MTEVCRRLLLLTHPDKRNAEHLDNLPDGDAIFGSEGLSSAIRFERGMFPPALIVIRIITIR